MTANPLLLLLCLALLQTEADAAHGIKLLVVGSNRFRVIDTMTNAVYTIPEEGNVGVYSIAVSPSADYVLYTRNSQHCIFKLNLATNKSNVFAGDSILNAYTDGDVLAARFNNPQIVRLSPDGKYALVYDYNNNAVRQIFINNNTVTTLLRSATPGYAEGVGSAIAFSYIKSFEISRDGTFMVMVDNTRVRRVNLTGPAPVSSLILGNAGTVNADGCGASATTGGGYRFDLSPDMKYMMLQDTSLRLITLSTGCITTLTTLQPSELYIVSAFRWAPSQSFFYMAGTDSTAWNRIFKVYYPPAPGQYPAEYFAGAQSYYTVQTADNVNRLLATFETISAMEYIPCLPGYRRASDTRCVNGSDIGGYFNGTNFLQCLPQFFCTGEWASPQACRTCLPGQAVGANCSASANAVCYDCTAGVGFSSTNNSATCAACTPACGAGRYQTTACTPSNDAGCAACSACAPGQIVGAPCTNTTNTVCAACPTGSICSNGTSPLACPLGSLCPAGASAPVQCPAGSVCPTPAQSLACAKGSYCGPGSTVELDCPLGYACATAETATACVSTSYCPPRSTQALLCPAGFACPNASSIAACPASNYFCVQGSTAPSPCGVCATGQYLASACTAVSDALCSPCTSPPLHASFTAVGSAPDACPWVCDAGFVLTPNGRQCDPCPPGSWCRASARNACPLHTASPPSSASQNDCLCLPGYKANGSAPGTSPCLLCETGSVCVGGANPPVACPVNRTSPPGASSLANACQCSPGFRTDGGGCVMCGPDEVCYDNGTIVLGCPPHSHASAGSGSLRDCLCDPGFYGPGVCDPCPADAFCQGGGAMNATPCTAHALAPEHSVTADACYCDRGYYETYYTGGGNTNNTIANQSSLNFTATDAAFMRHCAPCPKGAWCWTGVLNACPANSTSPPLSSRPFNCTCNPGYTGASRCAPCPPGAYKPDNGTGACLAPCPADAFCPLATAIPVPCPPNVPNTHPGAIALDQCQSDADYYLAMCPAPPVCQSTGSALRQQLLLWPLLLLQWLLSNAVLKAM